MAFDGRVPIYIWPLGRTRPWTADEEDSWLFYSLSGLSEPNGVEKCLICGIDSRNLEMNGSTKANNFDPIH